MDVDKEFQELRDEYEFASSVRGLSESSREQLRQYQPRLVAFIDIIGFREIVERMQAFPSERERVLGALRRLAVGATTQPNDVDFVCDRRMSCFSDSIVISYPTCPEVPLKDIVADICCVTDQLLSVKLALRGAVAMGNLYHTPGIVVGDGFTSAYRLEKHAAIVPRVVVSSKVLKATYGLDAETSDTILDECIDAERKDACNEKGEHAHSALNLIKDSDGWYFVDHLAVNCDYSQFDDEPLQFHRGYLTSVRS